MNTVHKAEENGGESTTVHDSAEENTIEKLEISRTGQQTQVAISTRLPLSSAPQHFATLQPPRIVLDFDKLANRSGLTRQDMQSGALQSLTLAGDATRTRLILNLKQASAYRLSRHDNTLRILLGYPESEPLAVADEAARNGAAAAAQEPTSSPPAPMPPMAPTMPSFSPPAISNIDFRRGEEGQGRIIVALPSAAQRLNVRQQGQQIVADIFDTELPAALQRQLDVLDFGTPVSRISAMRHGRHVRLVIDAGGMWQYHAYQRKDELLIEVTPQINPLQPGHRVAQGSAYRGNRLSLNFQNIEVRSVLQLLADFTGLNLIASDAVGGHITLLLKDIPWDQALDIVLQSRGLDMRRNGSVLWIAPRDELLTREKLELEQRAMIADLEPLRAEIFQLNYQKADTFRKVFGIGEDGSVSPERKNTILSRRGSAVVDTRTNQLFVTDTGAVLANIRKLLEKTDIAARQVLIEARIVEADDSFGRNLGARLGIAAKNAGVALGNSYGAVGQQSGQIDIDPATYLREQAVNLPAAALAGAVPGSFALSLFNAAANRFLNIELSALEAEGKGKIVSSPRLITADQQAALIEQGEEIPYQQATSSGATSTAFKKANLKLEVTPQITPDGHVVLNVDVNKDSRGTATPGGLAINTKHVKTQVQVEDGGTVVIGGIYTRTESQREAKVPLLGDIPVIGYLFKNTARVDDKTELLIFLTPRIVAANGAVR
ncbi:type IV pilus secretin PilQ [Herbaspirillum lusitanum]|uniref:Type IV pilus biogenesis and competence protein PilQ n=1 Tax=Herbaspirillum lusitanum TaxID=213312 RepID=A0ABW9ACB5_9BURK